MSPPSFFFFFFCFRGGGLIQAGTPIVKKYLYPGALIWQGP